MKVVIEFDIDNADFRDEDGFARPAAIEDVLRMASSKVALLVDGHDPVPNLRDGNGNTVGKVSLVDEP